MALLGGTPDYERDSSPIGCFAVSSPCDLWAGTRYKPAYKNVCLVGVVLGFGVGLVLGVLLPAMYLRDVPDTTTSHRTDSPSTTVSSTAAIRTVFVDNSYGVKNASGRRSPAPVSFVQDETQRDNKKDGLVVDGAYWGPAIEDALPEGFGERRHRSWAERVGAGVAVRLEAGCGRMQNRLVTFRDGSRGCVRYRQNTDQIQGELFSFYLARLLGLTNLAPSTTSVVDPRSSLWNNLAGEIAAAQWNSNRPVVLTQYIEDLNAASIPTVFRPVERHLDARDVLNMTAGGRASLADLVELAQWSDLIVFDYLTANLDRIVNNLYNYQWNANIMDAPAHNLAKNVDTNLLVFLDNESGLLHGYRLLKKYEIYHSVLLDNLCLFRKPTADVIKSLKRRNDVGVLLRNMFEERNNPRVKDVLPTLPEKSIKILNERIDKVYSQIMKCESIYSESGRT